MWNNYTLPGIKVHWCKVHGLSKKPRSQCGWRRESEERPEWEETENEVGPEDTGTRHPQDFRERQEMSETTESQDLCACVVGGQVGQWAGAEPQQYNRTRTIMLDRKKEHSTSTSSQIHPGEETIWVEPDLPILMTSRSCCLLWLLNWKQNYYISTLFPLSLHMGLKESKSKPTVFDSIHINFQYRAHTRLPQ